MQILTESASGYVAAADKGITVALDTELTVELIDDGMEREIVSKIQNMGMDAGFEVTDRIEVYFEASGKALKVLKAANFAGDVLAQKVVEGLPVNHAAAVTREQNVNGEKVILALVRK